MSELPPKVNHAGQLGVIQRWMQAVITHPDGVAAGLAGAAAQAEIPLAQENVESVILRSQQLTSEARLAVYANAYYARLLECLQSMFPALAVALGEDLFNDFAFAYLQQFPSQSYTLDRLADHFVEFLEISRQAFDDGAAADGPSWPEFLIDLARLEHAVGEVFDGPGSEELPQLSAERLAAVAPEAWATMRLVCSPSLQVLSFQFPLNDYYTAARRGEEGPLPEPAPAHLALWRRSYVVRRLPLTAVQQTLLSALLGGASVGVALEQAAAVTDDFDQFAAELPSWFREWSEAGFFLDLESAAPANEPH